MKNINIKITNTKELIQVLEDIDKRAVGAYEADYGTIADGFKIYHASLQTLIEVLKAAK